MSKRSVHLLIDDILEAIGRIRASSYQPAKGEGDITPPIALALDNTRCTNASYAIKRKPEGGNIWKQ